MTLPPNINWIGPNMYQPECPFCHKVVQAETYVGFPDDVEPVTFATLLRLTKPGEPSAQMQQSPAVH